MKRSDKSASYAQTWNRIRLRHIVPLVLVAMTTSSCGTAVLLGTTAVANTQAENLATKYPDRLTKMNCTQLRAEYKKQKNPLNLVLPTSAGKSTLVYHTMKRKRCRLPT